MRILPPFILALLLLLLGMWLLPTAHRGPSAHAQSNTTTTFTITTPFSTTNTAGHSLYLPLIQRGVGQPTPTIKTRSGIHLGNRGSDWHEEFFTWITTDTVTGTWPAAVVVLSDQLYDLVRYTRTAPDSECRIAGALIRAPVAFDYLTDAVHAGTKVVIRIMPSPGNFTDYANPGEDHVLSTSTAPAGSDYCDQDENNRWDFEKFRDYSDIAREMKSIFDVNTQNGWPADSFFFEPANEPNQEWYQSYVERGIANLDPKIDNKQAWIDMDDYFAALYDQVKQLQPELQVLAPSMSQDLYGEHYGLGTCNKFEVFGGNGRSGLDFMKNTFGYDIWTKQPSTPKADGFAWHNYWRQGKELWLPPFRGTNFPPTVDEYCGAYEPTDPEDPNPYMPQTDHFFQYLSDGMQQSMSVFPTFITEADLKSPCQLGEAGAATSKDTDAEAVSDSLHTFIMQETEAYVNTGYGAQYVIAWLLTNEYVNEEENCRVGGVPEAGGNPNYEQNWHEAYREDGTARAWFRLWWPATP